MCDRTYVNCGCRNTTVHAPAKRNKYSSQIPSRTLRSSDTNLLSVPRIRTCFGSRSFSVAAPTIWNSLPFDIRNSCSIASFHRKLKTFYFSTSSHVQWPASLLTSAPQIQWVSRWHCALYKLNLLTYLPWNSNCNDIRHRWTCIQRWRESAGQSIEPTTQYWKSRNRHVTFWQRSRKGSCNTLAMQ